MNKNKFISYLSALTLTLGLSTISVNADTIKHYDDVSESDWYYEAVTNATKDGLMFGVSANEFQPNKPVTRGMFIATLYRMAGEPTVNNANHFSDIENGAYYENSVNWAYENKIANGISQTTFAPDMEITREMATMLIYNFAKYKEANTDVTADVSNFVDFSNDSFAKDAICYCIGEGIITGKSENSIAPKDTLSRAETATILEKALDLYSKSNDIVILYTNDVHCGIESNLGYSGISAYKKRIAQTNAYTDLVDCGDAVQGEAVGTVSQGEYVIDIMNEVGYKYCILGNHEFDFGLEQLGKLIEKSNATYLNCNVNYNGTDNNVLKSTIPYAVEQYGEKNVAFIGVSTPNTITSSIPKRFMENDKIVVDFSYKSAENFYDCIQNSVDSAKKDGADIVVLMCHCGISDEDIPCRSYDIIKNTHSIDVVLDAHSHDVISSEKVENEDGKEVILSSTGTKAENIGKLSIKEDGKIETSLVSDYKGKDISVNNFIGQINDKFEGKLSTVIGHNEYKLSIYDDEGIRMVRTRETALGDLSADAYRYITNAQIGMVNGGSVRCDLPQGDVTIKDIITLHPFNNGLCVVKATGKQIQDALEWSMRDIRSEYKADGKPLGEGGGFYQVSGLSFDIDTSIESTVTKDENNMFVGVTGERRIKNIKVLNENGEYEPLDLDKYYIVASTDYVLLNNGDGQTAFNGVEVIETGTMVDNQVIQKYIEEYLKDDFSKYEKVDDRIRILAE